MRDLSWLALYPNELKDFLQRANLSQFLARLNEMGCKQIVDLIFVQDQDFRDIGFTSADITSLKEHLANDLTKIDALTNLYTQDSPIVSGFVNPSLSKILSIGYEFETHQYTKLKLIPYLNATDVYKNYNNGKLEYNNGKNYNWKPDGVKDYRGTYDMDGKTVNKEIEYEITTEFSVNPKNTLIKADGDPDFIQLRFNNEEVRSVVPDKNGSRGLDGVEWISTYKEIKQCPEVVATTFHDAYKWMKAELAGEYEDVTLEVFKEGNVKTYKTFIIKHEEYVYLKVKTGDFVFKPQMTFACKIYDAIELVRSMTKGPNTKTVASALKLTMALIPHLIKIIYEKHGLETVTKTIPNRNGYLFLAILMLQGYYRWAKMKKANSYPKAYIPFLPRVKLVTILDNIPEWDKLITICKEKILKHFDRISIWDFLRAKINVNGDYEATDTTHFEIKDDIILIEDRSFQRWFLPKGTRTATLKRVKNTLLTTVRMGKKFENLRTRRFLSGKYRKKCESSYKRVGLDCEKT